MSGKPRKQAFSFSLQCMPVFEDAITGECLKECPYDMEKADDNNCKRKCTKAWKLDWGLNSPLFYSFKGDFRQVAGAGLERVGLQLRRRKEEEGAQSVDAILLHTKIRGETAN